MGRGVGNLGISKRIAAAGDVRHAPRRSRSFARRGRRGNDWHAVHFYKPTMVSTDSPMPSYPWLFDGSPDKPNRRGLALITYVQWLGSWLDSYPYYEQLDELNEEEFE
jgi:hypothetical protein